MFEVDEENEEGRRQSLLSRTPPAAFCTGGVSTLRSHTVREARPADAASTEDRDRNLDRIPLSPLYTCNRESRNRCHHCLLFNFAQVYASVKLSWGKAIPARALSASFLFNVISIVNESFICRILSESYEMENGAKLRNQFPKMGSNPIDRKESTILRQVLHAWVSPKRTKV